MCITFEFFNEIYPLILLNNRDEAIDRPTMPLSEWTSENGVKIYSGKDARYGGTWLGINEHGYYCVLLNVHDENHLPISLPCIPNTSSSASNIQDNNNNIKNNINVIGVNSSPNVFLSRGMIVNNYLTNYSKYQTPEDYIKSLDYKIYNQNNRGFIVIVGDIKARLHSYFNSLDFESKLLEQNRIFGVSNYSLNSECFKVANGIESLGQCLNSHHLFPSETNDIDKNSQITLKELVKLLKNDQKGTLPSQEHENVSSIFVKGYLNPLDNLVHATRTSTIILIDKDLNVKCLEVNHLNKEKVLFEFKII